MLKQIVRILFDMPDFGMPQIDSRPKRTLEVKARETIKDTVMDGKTHKTTVSSDGTITTEIGKQTAKTSSDVELDRFDIAGLDYVLGSKWKKDMERAKVIKWHWQRGESAAQVEKFHTDAKTKQLQKGYSERTVSEYIRAYFIADNERTASGVPRTREESKGANTGNVVEW